MSECKEKEIFDDFEVNFVQDGLCIATTEYLHTTDQIIKFGNKLIQKFQVEYPDFKIGFNTTKQTISITIHKATLEKTKSAIQLYKKILEEDKK